MNQGFYRLYKTLLSASFYMGLYFAMYGQSEDAHQFSGTVTDAGTGGPVKARMQVEKWPNASEVHIVESNPSDGSFKTEILEGSVFLISISASYYKSETDTIDFSLSSAIFREYRLFQVKPGNILTLQKIYFAQGDYQFLPASEGELWELVNLLNEYPEMMIRLEGHTERSGGKKSNLELSEKRVLEIKNFLISKGIPAKRIKTAGYGDTRPVSGDNPEKNRRVEVRILRM